MKVADNRYGEGFLMRVAAERCSLARPRPALEYLRRWKLRGLGSGFGESVRTMGATAESGVRPMARDEPDKVANLADDPDKGVLSL